MYLKDPKDGKKSVTLTFLVFAFLAFAAFSAAQALGYAKSVGSFDELFFTCAALYFGRRMKVGTKSFSVDNGETTDD